MPESGLQRFIAWQKGYDTEISLINEQHKGILAFINSWYNEIPGGPGLLGPTRSDQEAAGLPGRVLQGGTSGSKRRAALKRLTQHYGYPKQEFEDHMQAHRQFMEGLLRPMIKEINVNPTKDAALFLETVVHESLFDIARWWSDHTPDPGRGGEARAGPQVPRSSWPACPRRTCST